MDQILSRGGPCAASGFVSRKEESLTKLRDTTVLVAGAGGLGCEVLKSLVMMGFRNLTIVDMDTIDITNLNRQFLFTEADIGRSKAEVAAEVLRRRIGLSLQCKGCFSRLEDLPTTFYASFKLVLSCLDSISARRWLNTMLVGLVTNPTTIIPCIDGGVEGLKGHVRVIVPFITPCFECHIDLFPPQIRFPLCTLAIRPRLPEHCIEWARLVHWDDQRPVFAGNHPFSPDPDDPEHLQWIYQAAAERAEVFGIPGVTPASTNRVLKNIIPSVGATNAVIAGMMVTEAFKYITDAAPQLDNFCLYNAALGQYSHIFLSERRDGCSVCGRVPF